MRILFARPLETSDMHALGSNDNALPASTLKPAKPKRRLLRWATRLGAVGVAGSIAVVGLISCVVTPPVVNSVDGVARTAELGGSWPGLTQPVEILWDGHLIPSIHASADEDLPYAIGIVHAHLRMSQMELFRKVSQGKLSEMGGPFAKSIDIAIRAFDITRAVPEIEAALDDETREWIKRYVEGINDYRATLSSKPADARTLNLDYDSPWTVYDVLAFSRLASVDVSLGEFFTVLGAANAKGGEDFLERLWSYAEDGVPSFGAEQRHELNVLTDIGRNGSNAFVVHGSRSASGGALVASDPHLGLPQPNIWCVIGYRSPSHASVGLSIPGIPFVLVGRSETIAWTGTNMQSRSSVMYQLPDGWEDTELAKPTRTEEIGVRWWFDDQTTIRESTLGPVVTDAPVMDMLGDGDIAFAWRGHSASDESGAFFRASQVDNWQSFRESFRDYAAGGQNILYGDAQGNIGQLMAIEAIPAAAASSRIGVVDATDPAFAWTPGVKSIDLPHSYNPEEGFLVSANNVPVPMEPVLVPLGNSNDRVVRMQNLLSENKQWTLDDLALIQRDTYSIASHDNARVIVSMLSEIELDERDERVVAVLDAWDGRYDAASIGALAYQRVLAGLIDSLYEERYGEEIISQLRSGPYVHTFVREDLEASSPVNKVQAALRGAFRGVTTGEVWGDMHRISLQHPIGFIPVLGNRYDFGDIPAFGSTTTVNKSAHAVQLGEHTTTFGANARLLVDMGTLDNNRVILLGGQDGLMGSDRFIDQAMMWNAGGMIQLPLSAEGQRAHAIMVSTLAPSTR